MSTGPDVVTQPAHRPGPTRGTALSRRLRAVLHQDKITLLAGAFILLVLVAAALAPLVAPHPPSLVTLEDRLLHPVWDGGTWSNPLGTDALGRDVLSRLIYGARTSLIIGLGVVLLAGTFGTAVGLVAGYVGGWFDAVVMRIIDAQMAFPGLLLILVVISSLGPKLSVILAVLALYGWMIYARLARGIILQLREEGYVLAAEMSGCRPWRMMRRHLLPNLVSPLMTQSTLELARVVLVEASLSYLGVGIQAPNISWGLMVAENQVHLRDGWWTVAFPGIALGLTVLAVNLVSSWLRIRTDPLQHKLLVARRLMRQRART